MAAGNRVDLIFAGDDRQLQKSFTDVGTGAKDMADKVGTASKQMATDADTAFGGIGSGADTMATNVGGSTRRMANDSADSSRSISDSVGDQEDKFQGLASTIGGTGDVMEGFKTGNVQQLAMGFADLADGLSKTFLPALDFLKDKLLKSVVPSIGGTSTALGIQATAHGTAATAAGVQKTSVDLLNTSLAATALKALAVAGALAVVGLGVVQVKKDLEGGWAQGLLGSSPVSRFLDRTFHTGGVVGGHAGQNVAAVLQAGEHVTPRGQSAGGGVTVHVAGSVITERDLGRIVADALRNNRLVGVT